MYIWLLCRILNCIDKFKYVSKTHLIVIKKQCFDLWYSTRDEHGIQNIVNSSSLISPPSTSDHILNLQLQDAEPRLQQENSDTNEELNKVR